VWRHRRAAAAVTDFVLPERRPRERGSCLSSATRMLEYISIILRKVDSIGVSA
jgi:hypothetical protein